eukprot:scaffold22607_cov123-Cylindrotheca_fusiformis.AAC.19
MASLIFLLLVVLLSTNTCLLLVQGQSTLYYVVRPFADLVLDVNYTHPDPTFGTSGELVHTIPLGGEGKRELYKDPCNYINETARFNTFDQFAYRPGGVSPIGDATFVLGSDNRTVLICKRIYNLQLSTSGESEGEYVGANEFYNIVEDVRRVYWKEIFSKDETCAGFCVSGSRVCQFGIDGVATCMDEIDNAHRFGDGWWQVENNAGDLNVGPTCNDQQECLDGSSALSVFFVLGLAATGSLIMTLVL